MLVSPAFPASWEVQRIAGAQAGESAEQRAQSSGQTPRCHYGIVLMLFLMLVLACLAIVALSLALVRAYDDDDESAGLSDDDGSGSGSGEAGTLE